MPLSSAHTDVMVESRRKTSVQVKVDDMLGERPPTSPHLSYSAPVLNAPVAVPLSTLSHAISSRVLRQGNDGVNHALVSRVRIPMIPLHRPLSRINGSPILLLHPSRQALAINEATYPRVPFFRNGNPDDRGLRRSLEDSRLDCTSVFGECLQSWVSPAPAAPEHCISYQVNMYC